ncbi:aldo/keto reductase [soil metagenome]
MNPRPLGRTGLSVPPLGLGTVKFGRTRALKYASAPAALPTDEHCLCLLSAAQEAGVTLIDTAPAYGVSEARLGELLPRIAPRSAWTIITKAGEIFDPATGESRYDFSPAALEASVTNSLAALRVDHIDILLLHFPGGALDAETLARPDAVAALERLQRAGKARRIGASLGSLAGAHLALADSSPLDVVMLTLNPADLAMHPAIARADARGLGVLIKKPLASGHADPAAALTLALGTPGVSAAILGTTSIAHLQSAVRRANTLAP